MTREAWTDERLDDLNDRVTDGFRQVDERFDKVDERFERADERMDAHFKELRAEIIGARIGVEARLDALYRTMAYSLVGLAGILVAGLVGIFGLVAG